MQDSTPPLCGAGATKAFQHLNLAFEYLSAPEVAEPKQKGAKKEKTLVRAISCLPLPYPMLPVPSGAL